MFCHSFMRSFTPFEIPASSPLSFLPSAPDDRDANWLAEAAPPKAAIFSFILPAFGSASAGEAVVAGDGNVDDELEDDGDTDENGVDLMPVLVDAGLTTLLLDISDDVAGMVEEGPEVVADGLAVVGFNEGAFVPENEVSGVAAVEGLVLLGVLLPPFLGEEAVLGIMAGDGTVAAPELALLLLILVALELVFIT